MTGRPRGTGFPPRGALGTGFPRPRATGTGGRVPRRHPPARQEL